MPVDSEGEGSGRNRGNPPDLQTTDHPAPPGSPEGEAIASTASDIAVDENVPRSDSGRDEPPPPTPPDWNGNGDEDEIPEFHKMSFLDHLEELRHRLFYCLIAVMLGFIASWTFADEIYAGLSLPLTSLLREMNLEDQLVYTNPVAPFTLYVHMAFMAGIFLASPFVLWQLWQFIAPGLYQREKRYAVPFIFLGSLLFISGGAFAYTIAFPAALRFLLTFGGQFRPLITVNEYFSLATTIILGMAVVFELPILILFLTLLRLMTPGFLLRNFRYAVLVIFIAAAAITPTPDIPTMMLFSMPLIGLYLFGVGLSYLVLRLRRREEV